jgi:hypothetical protein
MFHSECGIVGVTVGMGALDPILCFGCLALVGAVGGGRRITGRGDLETMKYPMIAYSKLKSGIETLFMYAGLCIKSWKHSVQIRENNHSGMTV